MAFNLRRINPLDLQPRKAVGVALPFQGRAVFNSTFTTKDATKSNLINFFLTGKNERVFNVDFGAGLRNLLFEQITDTSIEKVSEQVKTGLSKYFPTVVVDQMLLTPVPGSNTVNFSLKYSIRDTNIEDLITINFEN